MKNTTKVLKEANKYLVMQCITFHQPITIEDIMKITSVSRPTVLEVVKELMAGGYIIKKGQSRTTGGRPAELIALNGESSYAIGIDLEFPTVRIVCTNAAREIKTQACMKYDMEANAKEVLERLMDEVSGVIDTAQINVENIAGIGIGLPGNIDERSGISIHIERIKEWKNINIKEMFEEKFQVPVYVKNDVHFLALAEREQYISKEIQDFIYIGLRSGIGGAIFYHGKELDGRKGNAGFIGHTTVNPYGPRCTCGKCGCLDAFSSEIAMNREYSAKMKAESQKGKENFWPVKQFVERAEAGEEVCREILEQSGFYIGIAIANMIKTLEITTVVIGGCTQIEDSDFFKKIVGTVKDYLIEEYETEIDIRVGSLKEEEYPIGACCYVLDHIFEKPKLSLKI